MFIHGGCVKLPPEFQVESYIKLIFLGTSLSFTHTHNVFNVITKKRKSKNHTSGQNLVQLD